MATSKDSQDLSARLAQEQADEQTDLAARLEGARELLHQLVPSFGALPTAASDSPNPLAGALPSHDPEPPELGEADRLIDELKTEQANFTDSKKRLVENFDLASLRELQARHEELPLLLAEAKIAAASLRAEHARSAAAHYRSAIRPYSAAANDLFHLNRALAETLGHIDHAISEVSGRANHFVSQAAAADEEILQVRRRTFSGMLTEHEKGKVRIRDREQRPPDQFFSPLRKDPFRGRPLRDDGEIVL